MTVLFFQSFLLVKPTITYRWSRKDISDTMKVSVQSVLRLKCRAPDIAGGSERKFGQSACYYVSKINRDMVHAYRTKAATITPLYGQRTSTNARGSCAA